MVVSSKLLAVVTTAHQVSLAPSVSIIDPAVSRTITVSLSKPTGLLRGAAPLTTEVTALTSLTCRRKGRLGVTE